MEHIFDKLSSLMTTSKKYIISAGLEDLYNDVEGMLRTIPSTPTTILVCGEFKRGKSSFINAMLDEDICPVDKGITTAAVSVIRYGETPKVIRHYGDIVTEGNIQKEEVALTSIQDFVKGSSIDIRDTIMLEIEVPNERLKSGLCIIDTPGVGSMDPRHLFLTLYALPKADAIFFMTAAGEPMTATERDFFITHIAPLNKPTSVFLNKSDRFATEEERDLFVNDTQKKLSNGDNQTPTVIPVSAEQWIEFNKSGDDFAMQISNCPGVLTVIDEIKKQHESCLIKFVASRFVELINETGTRIQERLHNLQSNELNEEQRKLRERINELSTFQKQLANEGSPLRKKISVIIRQMQQKVLSEFTKDNILLSSEKLDQILESEQIYQDNGDVYLIKRINGNISDVAKKADSILLEAKKQIELELKQELFDFGKTESSGIMERKLNAKVHSDSMTLYRQGMTAFGICSAATTIGGVATSEFLIGATASSILGPIGLIAGLGFGVYHAFHGIRGARRKEQAIAIRRTIAPQISIAMEETKQIIQRQLEDFQSNILKALHDIVETYSKQIEETQKQLATSMGNDKIRQENVIKVQKELTFIIYVATELKNLPLR